MNRSYKIAAVVAFALIGSSCIKEKLELTYTSQEDKIDSYINSNKYTDSSKTDSLRVVYNGGACRMVMTEGIGDELKSDGVIYFYYAGYTFTGSGPNRNYLFTTNHEQTAKSAGWELTDANYDLLKLNMSDASLLPGLRNGLIGVRGGEHCQILFSGKYGYGNKQFGIIPANTALLYEIWVEAVSNE